MLTLMRTYLTSNFAETLDNLCSKSCSVSGNALVFLIAIFRPLQQTATNIIARTHIKCPGDITASCTVLASCVSQYNSR